jgi:hypothetical protein
MAAMVPAVPSERPLLVAPERESLAAAGTPFCGPGA